MHEDVAFYLLSIGAHNSDLQRIVARFLVVHSGDFVSAHGPDHTPYGRTVLAHDIRLATFPFPVKRLAPRLTPKLQLVVLQASCLVECGRWCVKLNPPGAHIRGEREIHAPRALCVCVRLACGSHFDDELHKSRARRTQMYVRT